LILLDTSFLVALEREIAAAEAGPAIGLLRRLRGQRVAVSVITVGELLEGAEDGEEAWATLRRFTHQPVGADIARRYALIQSRAARRMGENDAWIAATAAKMGARLVGRDSAFSGRSWLDYMGFGKG
jgi:predicted nucleic acid-binding protein